MRKDQKKIISIYILSSFFIFIFLYVVFVSKNLIFGIKLREINIKNGETYNEELLEITGNAKNAVNLTLNDHEIPIDEDGNFKETIAIFSGYNVINITAQDKFGNYDKKDYKIIYPAKVGQAN